MFITLLKKELSVEIKNREVIFSMLTFGMAVLLIFAFSFNELSQQIHNFAPGLFWTLVLLSSTLGLHRLFGHEKDFDAFSSLIASPIDRSILFLAKWFGSVLFLSVSELIIIPPFFLFLGLKIPTELVHGFGLVLLGNAGIMAVGVLISGLAMRAKMSAVLLPILLYPLITPLMIACVKATTGWYLSVSFLYWKLWVMIMATYVVIFGLAGFILFEEITEE